MQPMNETDGEATASNRIEVSSAPRVGDWLWRPWYAKLWWISIAVFWTVGGVAACLDIRSFPPRSGYFDYLAMVLHPQAALPVLGFGYILKLFATQDTVLSEDDADEDLYAGNGSMGFHRPLDYLADPTDPRSPLNPLNPLSPTYRNR